MRANRFLLIFLVFGFLIAGLAMRNGRLVAMAFPWLAYLAVAFWFAPQGPPVPDPNSVPPARASLEPLVEPRPVETDLKISVTRNLSRTHALPGQPVDQVLTLKNEGPGVDEIFLSGGLPVGVNLKEGPPHVRVPMSVDESVHFQQTVHAPRGEYHFPALSAVITETFDLFSVELKLPAPARLSVEPASETLRPFLLRPPQTRGFAGPVPARQGGRGTDFFSVREYQPGDSLRHVNWKVSSRAPRALYTNIYEQQRIADVGIILDAREQVEQNTPLYGSLFEYSVRAAAALTGPILRAGNRLGMLVYGPGMESVFPGYGKVQQQRILRALARAGAGHNFALESLAHIPTRFFPTGSQIILISPLSPEDPPLVSNLAMLGYGVLVISPNPLIFENIGKNDQLPSNGDLAWRLATAERRFQIQSMQHARVRVIDWDVRQSLAPLVQVALRRL